MKQWFSKTKWDYSLNIYQIINAAKVNIFKLLILQTVKSMGFQIRHFGDVATYLTTLSKKWELPISERIRNFHSTFQNIFVYF